jgi:hypothetical protein
VRNQQFKLCNEVLRRLDSEGVLSHVVLIGSWCLIAYEELFVETDYQAAIRTRDVDLLIPLPFQLDHTVDIEALLKDLDFVISHRGREGYMQFVHEDLMLEFIVPERGRGSDKAFAVQALGVNAQPLRFMDFLASNTTRLQFGDVTATVPLPAHFALIKLIVSVRRAKPVKRENDQRQALSVLRALVKLGKDKDIRCAFDSMPKTWQKTVRKVISELPLAEELVRIL